MFLRVGQSTNLRPQQTIYTTCITILFVIHNSSVHEQVKPHPTVKFSAHEIQ